jgi:hypothetical protein
LTSGATQAAGKGTVSGDTRSKVTPGDELEVTSFGTLGATALEREVEATTGSLTSGLDGSETAMLESMIGKWEDVAPSGQKGRR